MRHDARQRVLLAITTVMDDYGVVYEHVQKSHHPAVRFTVSGQTRTLTYGGGDPRAHMNARSQARRLLHELGLEPVQHQQIHTLQMAQKSDVTHATIAIVVEGLPLMETSTEKPIGDIQPDVDEIVKDEQADVHEPGLQPEPEAPLEIARFIEGSYVLFNSTKYRTPENQFAQNRFIAVKLDRELVVDKGHYLVIPIDIPDVVWDMPEHEYKSCFTIAAPPPISNSDISEPVVVVEHAEIKEAPPPPPIVEIPQPEPIIKSKPEPVVERRSAQFPPSGAQPSELRRGVSPQMGRVLLAMLYLHDIKNEHEVAGNSIQSMLSPVDAKQVSGMLGGGIRLRYVTRGTALDGGRGSHYILNPSGKKIARGLGTWPYDHRNLAVPPWLREMIRIKDGLPARSSSRS